MLSALRASTLKKRELREELKVKNKTIVKRGRKKSSKSKEKVKRKSIELQLQINKNQTEIQEEIERLCSIKLSDSGSSSSTTSLETVFESPVPGTSQAGSGVSLFWDSQADLQSPLKDTSDLLDRTFGFSETESSPPPALSRERSVSVSVNRANYVTHKSGKVLDLQPVCKSLNSVLDNNPVSGEVVGLISQDSFLERNLQAKQVETLNIIEESGDSSVEEGSDEIDEKLEAGDKVVENITTMDATLYAEKLKKIKGGYRRVLSHIATYTSEDVHIADKEEYKEKLKSISNQFDKFIKDVNTVMVELDEENEQTRIDEISKLEVDARKALKKNEKEVKEKITAVINENKTKNPNLNHEQESEKGDIQVLKIKKRIGFIMEKSVTIKNEILKVKRAKEMTDNEVREKIHESKEWEKTVKDIVNSKEKVEEESVGLDVDEKDVAEMKETVQAAVDILAAKVDNLKLEDRTRGLYSFVNKNISRENVVFPEAFAGEPGENVFKFKTKFIQAIHDSQVRDKDHVEVLRKHLTGEAKKLIGEHHRSLESALGALEDYFGDTEKIWNRCKDNLRRKLGGNFKDCWGQHGDEQRIIAIATAIEFLREASEHAENYPELANEIYHSSTLKLLTDLLPYDYVEKLSDIIPRHNITFKQKIKAVMEFLTDRKDQALNCVDMISRKKKENTRRFQDSSNNSINTFGDERKDSGWKNKNCRTCGGTSCQTSWHGLGCLELYKIKKKDERLEWLKNNKLCFRCGTQYETSSSPGQGRARRHSCYWFTKGKLIVKCKDTECWWAAATCRDHKDNLSKELIDWLKNAKIDIKNLAQGIFHGFPSSGRSLNKSHLKSNSSSCREKDSISSTSVYKMSKQEREKLQLGKLSRPMNDDDLVEFFKEDVKKICKGEPVVKSIPEGDPVFIMNVFKGATRPICAFIDSGCNCWVAKSGIPENELYSCKLNSGPIPMGVASAITVTADAEWASLLPLADGGHQVVRGLTLPEVTQEMPSINMLKVYNALKKKHRSVKSIQNLKVPKTISGHIDMIIGIKYANVYPELVHQFPSGLAVYKSKLLPVVPGDVACIGGPVEALEGLEGVYGGHTLGYLTQLTLALKNSKPRLEFFPDSRHIDEDIPGIHEILDVNGEIEEEENKFSDAKAKSSKADQVTPFHPREVDNGVDRTSGGGEGGDTRSSSSSGYVNNEIICQECGTQGFTEVFANSVTAQGEFKRFMKHQEAGLDSSYRCPKCRSCDDCIKGSGYERISLKQEAEQELIKASVRIDVDKGRPLAKLPFTLDPKEHLKDNSFAAQKRLQNVCRKYHSDEKVKNEVNAAFEKLRNKGHIKFYEDLNANQRKNLEAECGYTIPWDVVWKETSLSTPARTVYDASSKTSSGYSLNDILATGIPDLAKLLDVLLDWHIGPVAFVGDVSQFYCSVGLLEESWPYQKLLLREDLNPNGKLIKAVIISAIFGVCSSGGQSEEAIKKFCEIIKDDFPQVVKLLLKSRYVDDILKSLKNKSQAICLIKETDENLKKISMNIKGWGISGEKPPNEISDDGVSIGFSGLTWFPEMDIFQLNISSLHFGKKKRGKHSPSLEYFDSSKFRSVEEFLKDKTVTRRKCTSVVARLFDSYGKLEPLKLRCKDDLRKLIHENPAWDDPISSAQLVRWTENFKMIEDCRGLLYRRCLVPENAVSLKAHFWILCDAADAGIMIAAYARFPLPDNKWSCQNLLGKSLLAPDAWTIPKKELQALTAAANIKVTIERALEDWINEIYVGSDSEIALAWTIYENVKLNVFHRNRVNNIRSKLSLDQLFHVQGQENCADTGTRPSNVSIESILPGSEWLEGKNWLKESHTTAVANGIIKSVHEIKLSNEAKKVMKEGIIFDQFEADDTKVAVAKINVIDVRKVAEREAFADYIYPPLKRSFRSLVRITSLVLLAVRKFKEVALKSRIKAGKALEADLKELKPKNVKFTVFHVKTDPPSHPREVDNGVNRTSGGGREGGNHAQDSKQVPITVVFNINGVKCTVVHPKNVGSAVKVQNLSLKRRKLVLRLSDEDLSEGMEYLFKKATKEIIHFENKKDIEKIAILKDEIYYCNSRILESQELKTVGCLSETLDLESFIGIKFCVPIISKYSPLAISLAIHMHYIVNHHKGVESTYRMSLEHARILQGRQLFKEIGDDCLFCKKLRLKYVKQLMGPLSQNQLCISPIFYFTYMDMWGPLTIYCPGYEKRTRNRKENYKAWMLVMGCMVTGAVNCQVIEKKDTDAVMDGLNRFFCEVSVPKICYPDQDGALMKALSEGKISILDLQGRLHQERGLLFETCLPQGHYQHGRIERRIKMLQESLERSEMRLTARVTATGWQTIAKAIEREVNSVPLGFLHHQGSLNPLLRVLCPSLLKNGTCSDRAPKGLFTIPNSPANMMTNIETTYNMWFQLWNISYIPLVMDRPKWHLEGENLRTDDLVYFKLTDSKLAADWRLGKVEYVKTGRDGNVREVGIAFKNMDEDENWKHSLVDRPARSVVKLVNIEDTSVIDDMKKVEELSRIILGKQTENRGDEEMSADDKLKPVEDKHEPDDENHGREEKLVKEPKTKRKKRKSEVEKLLEDKIEISPGERRAAAKKDKYYTATEEDMIAAVSYTNIVSAFKDGEDPSLHSEEFYDMPGSVSNTAVSCPSVWSGITQPEGGGHTVGTEDGGGVYGASLEVSQGSGERVSCRNIFCDHDYSIYLL